MSQPSTARFDPATQPVLCKLARGLSLVREAKASQLQEQRALRDHLVRLAEQAGSAAKSRQLAEQLRHAALAATEQTFEKLISNTVKAALRNPPTPTSRVGLAALLLRGDEHVRTTLWSEVSDNGWLSFTVPLGADYDAALLVGESYAWCQIGDVLQLIDETATDARMRVMQAGDEMVQDGFEHRGENIYTVNEGGLLYFPARAGRGRADSVLVQIRPLILRSAPPVQTAG